MELDIWLDLSFYDTLKETKSLNGLKSVKKAF